ncbi:MAG TPA: hypothetical protein VIT44_02720 [Cyclobacteriaceae bacterium]
MKQIYVIIIILGTLISCSNYPVPIKLRKDLDCHNGKYTGLDTIINIQGFYTNKIYEWKEFEYHGSSYALDNMIFFADGICVGGINSITPTEELLNKMGVNDESFDWRCFHQGTYKIFNDTLKVQLINAGNANVWGGIEIWYKIVDKNTIVDFRKSYLGLTWGDKNRDNYKAKTYNDANHSRFVSVSKMPKSSSWLKKKKWFSCDRNSILK